MRYSILRSLAASAVLLLAIFCLTACQAGDTAEEPIQETAATDVETDKEETDDAQKQEEIDENETTASATDPAAETPDEQDQSHGSDPAGKLVVIDAGHQDHGNSAQEPIGPGASQTKAKVSGGTSGVASGVPEYELTLTVSMKLRDILTARGYEVVMIRESNAVDISNAERAQTANDLHADAFIRIHANGFDDHSMNGVLTMCQTSGNAYNAALYPQSRSLSQCVLNCFVAATGAKNLGIQETDTMSGINWCTVPVTIVEMGFMTNPEEDMKMQQEDYQNRMAEGIANGIDAYFAS